MDQSNFSAFLSIPKARRPDFQLYIPEFTHDFFTNKQGHPYINFNLPKLGETVVNLPSWIPPGQ